MRIILYNRLSMRNHVAAVLFFAPILCFGQGTMPQTITFANPGNQTMGAGPVTLAATSNSALAVTLQATPASVCTLMGSMLTLVANGTCTITASQGGNATYAAAASVTQIITISPQFPGVDLVLGIGSLITSNRTSYTVNTTTNVLEGGQIGRASPQLLAGVSFQLPWDFKSRTKANVSSAHKWDDMYRPMHAFVSLKFSTATNTPLVGYTFGLTYRLQKYLDFLVGYTLTEFDEPSPGFAAAAALVVANNPTLYPTYNASTMNNNHAGAFDGFPTQCVAGALYCGGGGTTPAAKGTSLYTGSITEEHFRGGLMIGISVPISLNGLFNIPKANQ